MSSFMLNKNPPLRSLNSKKIIAQLLSEMFILILTNKLHTEAITPAYFYIILCVKA